MTGKTFIITSDSANGEIVLKYNLNGYLSELKITAELNDDQYKRLISALPFQEVMADEMAKAKNSKIQVLPTELSFTLFYSTYDNKFGKKVQTENSWKKLSTKDKIDAIKGISKYNNYLQRNPQIQKAYPSTYLNQRYWENSYS